MKKIIAIIASLAVAAFFAFAGCQKQEAPKPAAPPESAPTSSAPMSAPSATAPMAAPGQK